MRADPNDKASSLADVYRAHPLLDPLLPSRQPGIARHWLSVCGDLLRDPARLERTARSFYAPLRGNQLVFQPLEQYFADATLYLDGLLERLPPERQGPLKPGPGVRSSSDLRELLRFAVEAPTARPRYEARRKLHLAKLLFDIDHCRSVRDGARHRALFEELLRAGLWSGIREGHEEEVCCRLAGPDRENPVLELGVPPSDHAQCWIFKVRSLGHGHDSARVDVYDYRSRFKRDAERDEEPPAELGPVAASPRASPPGLRRRSGSILSKMIRRGIGDANQVQDLLGARFIVRDAAQAFVLEQRLMDLFGGPFRWRDRVDTLRSGRHHGQRNQASSRGFQVLKGIVDVLVEDPAGSSPYLFAVELQILPLEPYLRTVHEGHLANHAAYKQRQLIEDLVPVLFPAEVYGSPAGAPIANV